MPTEKRDQVVIARCLSNALQITQYIFQRLGNIAAALSRQSRRRLCATGYHSVCLNCFFLVHRAFCYRIERAIAALA